MITWPAKVLLHVGDRAVVQVPGGLIPVSDLAGLLADGDATQVYALDAASPEAMLADGRLYWPANGERRSGHFIGWFTTSQNGQAALLESPEMLVPLIGLRELLPTNLLLAVDTQPAETDEGTPEGTGLPPEDSGPDPCGCIPDPCTPTRCE